MPQLALLRGVGDDAARKDYAFRETLTDRSEIEAVLRLLVELQSHASVRFSDTHTLQLRAELQDETSGAIGFRFSGLLGNSPFVIIAPGYNALYRIPVQRADLRVERDRQGESLLWIHAPNAIERVRSRRSFRMPIAQGLRVSFDHPLYPERRIDRPVLDLTHEGLSFASDASCSALQAGTDIPLMLIERENGDTIGLRAHVKSSRANDRNGALVIGCSVQATSAHEAERWRAACDELLFPNTRRGAAEVWSVYRDSGYFGLSDTLDGFDHLRPAYVEASRALASAPQLGCQTRWPAQGPAVATVTNLRLYPSCWFSYHLAVRPEKAIAVRAPEVLRELYRQYIEHCLALPGTRWQMAYVQHSAHWSMRVHVDIPRRYHATGEALIHDFRALQLRTVGASPRPRLEAPAQRVSAATDEELQSAMRALRTHRPAIYCEALEYGEDPAAFRLLALKRDWERHGMERDRELLIAWDDTPGFEDRVLAIGVVEAAQQGLHLFGLLDTLRIYALAPDGARAFDSVLDRARAWFRQRGRRSFCYLEEEGELHADGVDIKHMSRAMMTLLSAERLPEMLDHLYHETAKSASLTQSTRSSTRDAVGSTYATAAQ